jgi:excisionase family DNA binding protein
MAEQTQSASRFARRRRDRKWLEETTAVALTRAEVADLMDVDVRTVSRAIEDGQLPSIRLGRRVLVPRLALLALLGDENTEHPRNTPAGVA